MQSVVEKLSGLSQKIKVKVPSEKVKDEINKRINDLAKKVNIKGFRKGKVPASVVKMQYGEAVKQEVVQDILVETLQQAFEEHKLYPAGMPKIEITNIKEDSSLEFEASFEVFPEIKVDISGISIEKPKAKIEDEQVQDIIDKLRKQNAKWNEADKAAEKGDSVLIDFEGYIDDVLFEGGTAKDFRLELGSNTMIPGFEKALYGAKAGEKKEVHVTFPEDYHAKQYADKPAKFVVTVHKVMKAELPLLDDAFAKDLGVSNGTLAGLNNEVRENLERELERRIHNKVKTQLIEKILEKNEIEVPKSTVEEEIKRLQKAMKKQLSKQMDVKEIPDLSSEQFEDQAKKNVIIGLLLSQWIEDNEIKVNPDRVRDRVDQIASGYHHPHEIVNWYYGNKEALSEIEAAVLEEQAIEKILEKINIIEKDVTFDEIMNAERGGE